ncbi:hypothetical protein CHGG_00857 [Chaetomium globosum CBS 148.51]|uniref:MARVEL domain-containing protein n=1 Tax=Chaetomium globosum (strain ATCC 6205 / CBS 148.51 / DSM 1962 / NBRC 6347 / NRRL 1970) TaxID=306901 RepID=Q2HFZ7_CHAGB|nr:uncharacterized protein CHGG_00857 [Chaetomium globosum CBS 148.51]EAQ92622.1 hypothetical protein CHGG_00857 [Chaetomium globosum CBS 148.51]
MAQGSDSGALPPSPLGDPQAVSLGPYDGNNFILAVAIMTLLYSIYNLVAKYGPPAAYNYWVILGLDIFFVVMWLCSFALLAARVGQFFSLVNSYSSYSYYSLSDSDLIWLAAQAAAAGLGGVEFVLFLVSLIIHSIHLHRHRAAGLHCTPGTPPGPRQPTTSAAPAPVVIHTDKAGNPIYHHQQQQQQQQQPYPPQQPIPAHLQGQAPPPFYPAPGYAPVPMTHMQGQPVPVQGMPIPMQQIPPPQGGFYAPQPHPQQQQQPQPIVPQPTGDSQAPPSSVGGPPQMQPTPPPQQQQQQYNPPRREGGLVPGELGANE